MLELGAKVIKEFKYLIQHTYTSTKTGIKTLKQVDIWHTL